MSFVYGEVGEENRELWESIGWKNWVEEPIEFCSIIHWVIDREREVYMQPIGGFIDMPNYHDFAYQSKIIRMEVVSRGSGSRLAGFNKVWDIYKIYIPKSIWDDKDKILQMIKEAFSVYRGGTDEMFINSISAKISCAPECVETDYNGR